MLKATNLNPRTIGITIQDGKLDLCLHLEKFDKSESKEFICDYAIELGAPSEKFQPLISRSGNPSHCFSLNQKFTTAVKNCRLKILSETHIHWARRLRYSMFHHCARVYSADAKNSLRTTPYKLTSTWTFFMIRLTPSWHQKIHFKSKESCC